VAGATLPRLTRSQTASVAGLIVLYAGLVVWLTWPLGAHVATHRARTHPASGFDPLHIAWALSHEAHALTSDPTRFAEANIYFPAHRALFYGDGAFGALPYFMPTYLLTGNPMLALNLTFLGCIALTAWALHVVVRIWTGSHLGGFVAASTFLLTRWTLWEFVPTAPQYSVLQYVPFIVLMAAKPATSFRQALILFPLVILQTLASVLYMGAAIFAPLTLLALFRILRPVTRGAGLRLLGVLVLALLALFPVALEYAAVRANNPHLGEQTYWAWWHPTTALPWGLLWGYGSSTAVPIAAVGLIVVGAVSLALGRAVRRSRRALTAWAHSSFWAVTGVIMALSPAASWNGRPVRLPNAVIADWLPIYGFLRIPNRLGAVGLIGLALLAGVAFAECARRFGDRARSGLLALIAPAALAALVITGAYVEYSSAEPSFDRDALPQSYPLAPAISPDSPVVRVLQAPGGPLLELPVDLTPRGCLPGPHAQAEYRSIFHWRPLLNGYNGYWPTGFLQRMELANRLPDPEALTALRRETGVEMILVHLSDLDTGQGRVWLALAEHDGGGLRLVTRDRADLLFAVEERATSPGQ
jgi:hypothetical protein